MPWSTSQSPGPRGAVTGLLNHVLLFRSIFDFVLAFGGCSTVDSIVVPALVRFVENVYVYCMEPRTALLHSFGEDVHALDSTSVALIWAEYEVIEEGRHRRKQVNTKVFALANQLRRPWGIDFWQCHNCHRPMQYLRFNLCGKRYHGDQWIRNKVRYTCSACSHEERGIGCPEWIKGVQGFKRLVEFPWPLTVAQASSLGIQDAQISY